MALTDNIVAYWKFDEGTGTTAADATGNGYNLSLTGTQNWTTSGKINDAFYFDGSSYFGTSIAVPSSAFSFSSWVKSPSAPNNVGYHQWLGYANSTFTWSHASPSFIQSFSIFNAGSWYVAQITSTLLANTWYHIAGTWDGTNIAVFLNGSLEATTPASGTFSSSADFSVGASDGGSNKFTGTVDEAGFWSRGLSSTEVSQLYNSGAGLQHPFTGGGSTSSLFRQSLLNGLGSPGPLFNNPLGRSMIGWVPSLKGLLVPDRRLVTA